MLTPDEITEIYCIVDDFCLEIDQLVAKEAQFHVNYSAYSLCPSEVICLLICFQHSGFRNLKRFYIDFAQQYLTREFPDLPSYNRFVELQAMSVYHHILFTKICCCQSCDGISFIDSFPLAVCHNKRIGQHRVFKNIAQRGHTSMGFFYGFKGHIIINSQCEIIDFLITTGNISDNHESVLKPLCRTIFGRIFGDKGYLINAEKMAYFMNLGVRFISKIRKNMKNKLMNIQDKWLLKQRSIVETVIDQLKNIYQIHHTRHRSPVNFINNFLSAIGAYFFKPQKPKLRRKSYKNSSHSAQQLLIQF